jgi:ABC-type branched-subunit amino acid transport system ATPase component
MYALQINNLIKKFGGVHAIDSLSIAFEKGKITGIIGPNGSGKTTLVNVLTGMASFNSGAIILDGAVTLQKIKAEQAYVFKITRTFQEVRLFNQISVLENILVVITERNIFSALFEKHKSYHLEKAREILEKVNLWEKRDELAGSLSYGQRKLLEIARAVVIGAEIILFDEPFAGLFPEIIKIIKNIILELKHAGKTILLIEHNIALIRELADHLFVMDSGKLLAAGKPEQVLSQRNVIEAYLGE